MKFSIITPYYNSLGKMENYFNCLKNQTYKDFEVVLINDASRDDSEEGLCSKLSGLDCEVQYVKNETNRGPGYSRNRGIELSKGEYLLFLDADDWIREDALELIAAGSSSLPDCITFGYKQVNQDGKDFSKSIYYFEKKKNEKQHIKERINTSTLGKAYRSDFIKENNIRFFEAYLAEDFYFTLCAMHHCKRLVDIDDYLYFYQMNSTSITNSSMKKHIGGIKLILDNLYEKGILNKDELRYFILRENVYEGIIANNGEKDTDTINNIKAYSMLDIIKVGHLLQKHQLIILLLYKMHFYGVVQAGIKKCKRK